MSEKPSPQAVFGMSFLAAALFSVAAELARGTLIEITEAMRPGAQLDLVSVTACQLLTCLAFVFLIARLYARDTSLRVLLGLREVRVPVLALCAVGGAAAEMPVSFVERYWAARFPLSENETQSLEKLLASDTLGQKIAMAVSIVVVWPLAQELFYRGAIFGRLRVVHDERSVTFAVAAFYALSFGSAQALPSAVIQGLAFAWLRAITGSTWAALAAHSAFMAVAVGRIFRDYSDAAIRGSHAAGAAAVAVVCGLVIARLVMRDERASEARVSDGPAA